MAAARRQPYAASRTAVLGCFSSCRIGGRQPCWSASLQPTSLATSSCMVAAVAACRSASVSPSGDGCCSRSLRAGVMPAAMHCMCFSGATRSSLAATMDFDLMTAFSLLRPATCQPARYSKEDGQEGGCMRGSAATACCQLFAASGAACMPLPYYDSQNSYMSYNLWVGPGSKSLGHGCLRQWLRWQLSLKPSNVAQVRCYRRCRRIHGDLLRYTTSRPGSSTVKQAPKQSGTSQTLMTKSVCSPSKHPITGNTHQPGFILCPRNCCVSCRDTVACFSSCVQDGRQPSTRSSCVDTKDQYFRWRIAA